MSTNIASRGMSIMTGTTHPEMARLITSHLGVTLASTTATENSAHEILVDIKETVRGRFYNYFYSSQVFHSFICGIFYNYAAS